jgi:hypothetical protein
MKQVICVSSIIIHTRKKEDCLKDLVVGEIGLHLCGAGVISGYQVLMHDDGTPGIKLKAPHYGAVSDGEINYKPVFTGEIQEYLDKLIWTALLAIKGTLGGLKYNKSYLYDITTGLPTIISEESA